MIKGYTKLGSHVDSRLPITLPILHRIIESSAQLAISRYGCCQFQAMCSMAFFAFLRVGEMTITSHNRDSSLLQVHQLVKLLDKTQRVVAFKVVFHSFKHNYNQRTFSIVIHRQHVFCPVQFLLGYLTLRGDRPGPLFVNLDNKLLHRSTLSFYTVFSFKPTALQGS